jgi:two-component system, OmpR family, alkaline phosphatase synthesis response regulator PhoP
MATRSILIVDNDASLVAFLAFFFEDRGFTVYTAHDGSEAIGLARRHRPPVILSDMMMGRVHGFELLQQVRADPDLRDTPVIIMSAKSYKSDIDRALSLGASEYIIKPFKTEDLLELVERRLAAPGGAGGG